MSNNDKLTIGLDLEFDSNIENAISSSGNEGYDFICIDLFSKSHSSTFLNADVGNRLGDLTNPEFLLDSQNWNHFVVAKLSNYLREKATSDAKKAAADHNLITEIGYCSYLGLPAIMLSVNEANCVALARIINNCLLKSPNFISIWIQISMTDSNESSSWELWNKFRVLCNHHNRIGLSLVFSSNLPDSREIKKFLGEPVKSVVLPTSIFLSNKKGFPVLSKAHQSVLGEFMSIKSQVVISGSNIHNFGMSVYVKYIEHLHKNRPNPDRYQLFSEGYEDYLQAPLQPLMDNLESATYEVFEKDPVKYNNYQMAIYACLKDKYTGLDRTVVVMVVGAGRGPLVRAALKAANDADVKIKCYAVEKNVNATVTLQLLQRTEWVDDDVTVVNCDMREWKAPELADIVVSELLGSFGDNELSPECLDGTEKFLKADAVSIPSSYTSYLAPISSHKLFNEVLAASNIDKDKPKETAFETPYVVRIHNYFGIAEPQAVFTFKHPSSDEKIDQSNLCFKNSKYKELKFNIESDCILHGFAGYFECQLYKDINISILPKTHSPMMFSWFPIFFPILNPIQLKKNDELTTHMWRVCSLQKVWYEWTVTSPTITPIHNPAGRSYTIGL